MYGWNEHQYKLTTSQYVGDGTDEAGNVKIVAAVYTVGEYSVTVKAPDVTALELTYSHIRRHQSDPRQTFPNMTVEDGEMRLPISDIVAEVLKRLDPADLAKQLWSENEEVRKAFLEAMADAYQSGIRDEDRREWLTKVQACVHDAELERKIDFAYGSEHAFSEYQRYWQMVAELNRRLTIIRDRIEELFPGALEAPSPDAKYGLMESLNHLLEHFKADDEQTKIGGKGWTDARDFWRSELQKQFAPPLVYTAPPVPEPIEPPSASPIWSGGKPYNPDDEIPF